MKKIYLALVSAIIVSCSGYQPLYGELGDKMLEIDLVEVKMKDTAKDLGERRLGQKLSQKLGRIFTNDVDNDYDLYVELNREETAIATKSDDTDKRKSISVEALMTLKEKLTGKVKFETTLSRYSSYTVQDEPFATEAARTKALESIVSSLSNDIIQRAALWFRGYEGNEDNK